jgi:D-xylose transport system substrate-binding protein
MSTHSLDKLAGLKAGLLGSTALLFAIASFAPASAKDAKDITIGFAFKTHVEKRWDFEEAKLKEEAAKAGVKAVFQWANNSPTTQASQFENLLSQKVDVIVINSVDGAAAGPLVDEAHQQGVPVIGYNSGVSTAKLDYILRRDDILVGAMQAEQALKFAPHGTFAIIKGDAGNDVAHKMDEAYEKIIVHNPDVKIVYNDWTTNWDPKLGQAAAENILTAQNDKIDGFIVAADGLATGVAQALISRKLQGKVYLSGNDGDPFNIRLIAEGVQTMTAYGDIADQAHKTILVAIALANGKQPDLKTTMNDDGAGEYPGHWLAPVLITKDNICDLINNISPVGYITVADVYPDNPNACPK